MQRIRMRYLGLAFLLFTLGILFFVNNFNLLQGIDFSLVLYTWPLLLILIGLYFVFKGTKAAYFITSFTAILFAIVSFAFLAVYNPRIPFLPSLNTSRQNTTNPSITFSNDSQKYINSINEANLVFRSEKGDFYLRGTTDTLTEYDAKSTFGQYIFQKSDKDGVATVDLRFDAERVPWKITSEKNSLDLKLNPKPIWNLDYEVDSSTLAMDLGYYRVNDSRIKVTASRFDINIERNTIEKEMNLEIDSSTSSSNIRVQKNIGIQIKVKTTLSTKDLQDFEDKGNNTFQTKDFDSAEKKLFIDADISFSSLKIERFD